MGAYDRTEVCELIGLFLLYILANKFNKNSIGLYRIERLSYSKILGVIIQIKYAKITPTI